MSLNIIDLIKGQLGPALISQAATQFGESESGISKAISGLLPLVVGGMANNADKPGVLDAVKGAASSGMLNNLLGSSGNSNMVTSLVSSLFGDNLGGIVNSISSFAGVNSSTSSSLLNLVTGATLGSVGKYAEQNNLSSDGILSLLKDQKGLVSSMLPAGLSMASLGLGNWFGTSDTTEKVNVTNNYDAPKVDVKRDHSSHVEVDKNDNDGGGSIWKWLLPLLLFLLVSFFLWKQCDKKKAESTNVNGDSIETVDSLESDTLNADSTVALVDEDIMLNGVALKGYKGGMEDQMIQFLSSKGYENAADDAALKDVWYAFDHVNFQMGSSKDLMDGSMGQLENLLAILKAYPNAKIKIGGYTDKTGDAAINKKISQERADFIKNWLTSKGVGAQVNEAQGYGSEFATVPAEASDAERAKDRKMAIRFTK